MGKALFALLLLSLSQPAWALTYALPASNSNIVGDVFTVHIEPGDNLLKLGRRYDIGYQEMVKANPHLNPRKPKTWSKAVIPAAFILPDTPREGIVINLPEMRLYYYPKDANIVMTYPIGVGRSGWLTPTATTKVIGKDIDPEWHVPESIKEYMAEKGVELPDIMPPGPENPLGEYAMRLGLNGYLIHGTNKPSSVGKRSSSGCIRMLPEDVEELFPHVSIGTPVRIVNQPYKLGWYRSELYVEAHRPFGDQLPTVSKGFNAFQKSIGHYSGRGASRINWQYIYKIAKSHEGFPRFISR